MNNYIERFRKEERDCWYDMITCQPADPTTPELHLLQFKYFDEKTQARIAKREWEQAFSED
jgi:hypothetical protein